MMADDQPVPDDEMAELLRRVGDDSTLRPQDRDRAREAMFAEFDAIVGDTRRAALDDRPEVVPAIELTEPRRRTKRRSVAPGWSAAAAASLLVLTLVAVSNLRDESTTSDSPKPTVVSVFPTLAPVVEPPRPLSAASLPFALDDAKYRATDILDGVAFSGADGLQVFELRSGLLVMDSVSDEGDLRARFSIFEAESNDVADLIDAAVEDGDLQVTEAQFTGVGRSLRRQDLTVTGEGVADLGCVEQNGCLELLSDVDGFGPSIWARSENFLIEVRSGDPTVFVLVQTKTFGDPLLSRAFEIIDSLEFG